MDTTNATIAGSNNGPQTYYPLPLTEPLAPATQLPGVALGKVSAVVEPQDYYENQNLDRAFPSLDVLMRRLRVIVKQAMVRVDLEDAQRAAEARKAEQQRMLRELQGELVQRQAVSRKAAELEGRLARERPEPQKGIIDHPDVTRASLPDVPGTPRNGAMSGKSETLGAQAEATLNQAAPSFTGYVRQQGTEANDLISKANAQVAAGRNAATTPSGATAISAAVGLALPAVDAAKPV
jgi:hypothetical protein